MAQVVSKSASKSLAGHQTWVLQGQLHPGSQARLWHDILMHSMMPGCTSNFFMASDKARMPSLTISIQHSTESPIQSEFSQEKEKKNAMPI